MNLQSIMTDTDYFDIEPLNIASVFQEKESNSIVVLQIIF